MAVRFGNWWQRGWRYLREYGARDTLSRGVSAISFAALASLLHKRLVPKLGDLSQATAPVYFSATELLRQHLPSANASDLELFRSEYALLQAELETRYAARTSWPYPSHFSVQGGCSFLLYALVRFLHPELVLETGVANGHSSFFLIRGMLRNGHGTLHSIDVNAEVGAVLNEVERSRWTLHLLQGRDFERQFAELARALPPVDLFFHDSDHWYRWHQFELGVALSRLRRPGILASDDVDYSFAFSDFCRERGLQPVYLADMQRVIGLVFLERERQVSTE